MADAWTPKLDTYLDGELAAGEMRELDTHLRTCSTCAADVLNRLQLKRAVQSTSKRYVASIDFRQRVKSSITSRPRRSPARAWLFAGAVFASVLVAGLIAVSFRQQRFARQHVFSEAADIHVATLASANPVDVISSDRHTVKPWFEGRVPFTFNLPELQNSEFVLVGGRTVYLRQSPAVELIFQVRKHRISVFIVQERAVALGFGPDSGVQRQATFNLETWGQSGLRYFVIGDASGDDIRQLTDLLKKAAGE
jgi:anti-sigma factor RsiW